MAADRSLGGIGQLFRADELIGQVYYNIAAKQPRGVIVCTIVFMDYEVVLPNDDRLYKLCLEDGRYLLITVSATNERMQSPYFCTARDGILHTDTKNS